MSREPRAHNSRLRARGGPLTSNCGYAARRTSALTWGLVVCQADARKKLFHHLTHSSVHQESQRDEGLDLKPLANTADVQSERVQIEDDGQQPDVQSERVQSVLSVTQNGPTLTTT